MKTSEQIRDLIKSIQDKHEPSRPLSILVTELEKLECWAMVKLEGDE